MADEWEASGEETGPQGASQSMKRARMARELQLGDARECGAPAFGVVSRGLAYATPVSKTAMDGTGRWLSAVEVRNAEVTPVGRGSSELAMAGYHSRKNQIPGSSRAVQRHSGYGDEENLRGSLDAQTLDDDDMRCSYKCRHMLKSEVLEELDLKRSQVSSLEQELLTLKEAIERGNMEKKRLKDDGNSLQQSVNAAVARETAAQAARKRDAQFAEETIKQHFAQAAELQNRVREEESKRRDVEGAASAAMAEVAALKAAMKKAEERKDEELTRARDEVVHIRREAESAQSRLEYKLDLERKRADRAEARMNLLEREIDELDLELMRESAARQTVEMEKVEAQAAALLGGGRSDEADVIIKQLRAELAYGAADMEAARQLKQRHAGVQLLRERLAEEQARAELAETQLASRSGLELQVAALEAEIRKWSSMARSVFGVENASDLLDATAEMQSTIMALREREGVLEAALEGSSATIRQLETRVTAGETALESAQREAREIADELRRVKQKLADEARGRGGLKSILESYDAEERIISSAAARGVTLPGGTPEKSKSLRLQECEAELEKARERESEMEEELKQARKMAVEERKTAESLRQQLAAATAELQSMGEADEKIKKGLEFFEAQVAAGCFDPSTTKVLHMKVNPESEGRRAMEDARAHRELESLRARVAELQGASRGWLAGDSALSGAESGDRSQGGGAGGGEGGHGEKQQEGSSRTELEKSLLQKVAKLEKSYSSYKRVWHSKISLLREACNVLFGYRVDMADRQDERGLITPIFTVRSQFAADDNEVFQFQFVNKKFEMLANAYTMSPELEQQVATYLTRFQCFPAFTANHTLELFNQTTMG